MRPYDFVVQQQLTAAPAQRPIPSSAQRRAKSAHAEGERTRGGRSPAPPKKNGFFAEAKNPYSLREARMIGAVLTRVSRARMQLFRLSEKVASFLGCGASLGSPMTHRHWGGSPPLVLSPSACAFRASALMKVWDFTHLPLLQLISCLLSFLLLFSCSKTPAPPPPPSYPARIAVAAQNEPPILIEALGHVDAITAIDIRSRIEGELTGVYFTQGQEVKKGDLLFTVDPRPYQAALKQAEATLEENLAILALAEEKVKRYMILAKDEYYSQIDYETLQSNYAAAAAVVKQNQAQVDSALINLDYCWIYAPIDGMTGILQVDFGNLVGAAGSQPSQPLITLNQMAPIFVTFAVPEFQLP